MFVLFTLRIKERRFDVVTMDHHAESLTSTCVVMGAADHLFFASAHWSCPVRKAGKDVTEPSQQSTTKEAYNEQPTITRVTRGSRGPEDQLHAGTMAVASEDAVLDFLPLSTRGEHRGGHEALV